MLHCVLDVSITWFNPIFSTIKRFNLTFACTLCKNFWTLIFVGLFDSGRSRKMYVDYLALIEL